jgi:amino acid transporter
MTDAASDAVPPVAAHDGQPELESKLSLFGAVAIGIGGMVGGGIFAVLGVAAEEAGGATPLAFLIAGVVAGLTAYSYSKLSVRHRSAGGTVTFIHRVFGIDFITGSVNIVLWAGYIATTGLYAAAFGHYGASLLPGDASASAVVFKSLAVVGVLIPWIINLAKASLIAKTEGIIVTIKLAMLLVVIVAGVPAADRDRFNPSEWASPMSLVAAGMLVFVAYEGFELISNASSDVTDPARTLPRAYGWSVGIVIVLYIAIAAVVVASLSPAEIQASSDFALAEAASTSLGQVGFVIVGISAVLATFSAINATLYGAARLSYTIAVNGELPSGFRLRPWHQPIGLHVTAVLGVVIAVALPLESISSLCSSIFLGVFTVVNVAAFRAGADAEVRRPVAACGAVASAGSLVVLTARNVEHDPASLVVLGALIALALIVEHGLFRRSGRTLALDTKN